ncbi:MAG: proton-conducting transporter membrane subunit [Sulfolobales archaeon]
MHSVGATPALLVATAFALPLAYLRVKAIKVFHEVALATAVAAFALSLHTYIHVISQGGPVVYRVGGWPPPLGIVYEVDAFSSLLATYTALILVFVVAYSYWYLRDDAGTPYYYSLLFGLEAGLIGIYYTGDVFNLFVMLEVLGITCYGLVAYYRSSREAVEASFKYAFFGAIAGLLYFVAAILTYSSFGNLTMGFVATTSRPLFRYFYQITDVFIWGNITGAVVAILALSLWTFTFKAGVFPNHFWLPDAHPAAPTPISAVLSGLVVNAGAYASMRFLYTIFGVYDPLSTFYELSPYFKLLLSAVGAVSAVFASVMMIIQRDVKRLIAYSTIMHLGLVFTGFSIGTVLGVRASIYHVLAHAVGKALLFMSAGVAIEVSRTRNISDLKAVGRLSPVVGASIVMSCLSLVGLPPLGGFFSKFALYQAFIESGRFDLVAVLFISSGLALLGYFKVIQSTVFSVPPSDAEASKLKEPLLWASLLPLLFILVALNPLIVGVLLDKASESVVYADKYIGEAIRSFLEYVRGFQVAAGG